MCVGFVFYGQLWVLLVKSLAVLCLAINRVAALEHINNDIIYKDVM